MEWTPEIVDRIGRLLQQGVSNAALAERYGHRDGISFHASYSKAVRRLQRAATDSKPAPRIVMARRA
jgi:hypothetical protein